MEKEPFYTVERAEEVAVCAMTQLHSRFYSTGTSSDEESMVKRLTDMIQEETFNMEVGILNSIFGTRRRKTMKAVTEELTRRNIPWTDAIGDMSCVNVTIGGSLFRIDMFRGVNLALLLPGPARVPVMTHHCTAGASDIADFLAFFSTVQPKITEKIRKKVFRDHKAAMLCEIEFPFVEQKVREFMDPRGLTYRLYIRSPKILIDVQIVKDIWMRNALTSQNVEDVIRLVPYLIKRPDCIRRDGLGFEITHIFR